MCYFSKTYGWLWFGTSEILTTSKLLCFTCVKINGVCSMNTFTLSAKSVLERTLLSCPVYTVLWSHDQCLTAVGSHDQCHITVVSCIYCCSPGQCVCEVHYIEDSSRSFQLSQWPVLCRKEDCCSVYPRDHLPSQVSSVCGLSQTTQAFLMSDSLIIHTCNI